MEHAPVEEPLIEETAGDVELPPQIEHDFLHIDSQDRERLEKYFDYLQRRISDPSRYMDKGGGGYVYDVNGSMCIKMIEDRQKREVSRAQNEHRRPKKFDLGNSPYVEARIQESLGDFVVAGVRSPILVQYIPGNFWHGIAMEKLNAVNFQKCLNGDHPLPKSFEKGKFMTGLGDYFDALHKERRVVHGDLEARNIMVDRVTGLPIVIDFGRSRYISDEQSRIDEETDWKKYDALDRLIEKTW